MQYAPALEVLHRIQAKLSLAAPLKSMLVCAYAGHFFFLLEELTPCYAEFIFLKVVPAKGVRVPSSPPQKEPSRKSTRRSVGSRISL